MVAETGTQGYYLDPEGYEISTCCNAHLTFHDDTQCCKKCWGAITGEVESTVIVLKKGAK